jgi:pilus assembly protein FimV
MRRIFLLLILLAASVSAAANVSLGEIEVRSFLNQPLQAQFRADGSVLAGDEVQFRIAPEDAYRRAGLERATVPPDLNIDVQGTGTSRIVRLTTQRPVREPYLGLLLEVRWAAGRALREFTILLDPPVAFAPERSVAPVISSAPAAVAPAPAPVAREVPATVRTEPDVQASTYTVRRGDTLFAIVSRQGYAGATSQQAMLAIRDANPQAFVGGNINQLRAGAQLRLPEQAEVAAYGRQEAVQEVRRQTEEWKQRNAPVAPTVVTAAAPVPDTLPEAAPELRPAAETEPESATATEPTPLSAVVEDLAVAAVLEGEMVPAIAETAVMDRLEILGEGEFEPTLVASARAQVLEEALLSQQVAVTELRDELSVLRTELAERDQLITMMNAELAQIEERMQALREDRSDGALGGADAAALHERLLADPLLLLLAATSMLLFLLLLVSVFRPRSSLTAVELPVAHPPRTVPTATAAPKAPAAAAAIAGTGAAAAVAGTSGSRTRDKRAAVSLGSPSRHIDVGEDPRNEDILADVDLYLAYGMTDQAITALETAIRDGREDPEYRVRLVEAYAANDDGDAVRREAEVLLDRLGPDQHALRERVAEAQARCQGPGHAGGRTEDRGHGNQALSPDAAGHVLEFDLSDDAGRLDADRDGSAAGRNETDADYAALRFDLDEAVHAASGERGPASEERADDFPELILPDLEPVEPQDTQHRGWNADSDTSENGMKLSLAEAFVEMGDREGALSLLDEILPTATDAQKAKADAMRRQIEGSDG